MRNQVFLSKAIRSDLSKGCQVGPELLFLCWVSQHELSVSFFAKEGFGDKTPLIDGELVDSTTAKAIW